MIFKVDLIHNLDFYSKEEFNVINDLFNKLNWYGELEPSNGSFILLTKDICYYTYENFISEDNNNLEMSKELKYLEGLLDKINAKLSNDKFLKNAKPEIIELERKKRIDTENKIKVLKLR